MAATLLTTVATACTATDRSRSVAPLQAAPAHLLSVPPLHGRLFATGWNDAGQLGTGTTTTTTSFATTRDLAGAGQLGDVVAVDGGLRHTVALLSDGSVVAWGDNRVGQLGSPTPARSEVPLRVRAQDGRHGWLTGAVEVAADSDFSMALMRDGTVVTWGRSDVGQRGIGRLTGPLTPTTVLRPDGKGPLTGVTAIDADGRSEIALLSDGQVVAWGDNRFGQLGDGTRSTRMLPIYVKGLYGAPRLTDVRGVAMGGQHALALLTDGRVAAWGSNARGQLGDATRNSRAFPDVVVGVGGHGVLAGVTQVSAGELDSLALLASGAAVGWGDDTAGQLGNGRRTGFQPSPSFVLVAVGHRPLGHLRVIVAGEGFSAAITDVATVVTWGAGRRGQLGAGGVTTRTRPGPVVATWPRQAAVVAVGAGVRHLLAVVAP